MPGAICPACGRGFRLEDEDTVLYGQVNCPHCNALLEVIDENPVILEELED